MSNKYKRGLPLNNLERTKLAAFYSTLVDSGCKDVVSNSIALTEHLYRCFTFLRLHLSSSTSALSPFSLSLFVPLSFSLPLSFPLSVYPHRFSLSLSLSRSASSPLFLTLSLSSRASKQCLVYTAVARYFML